LRHLSLLFVSILLSSFSYSQTVTNLHGFYRNGQVFLTWKNLATEAYYKVYRSTSAITNGNQLGSCEYLGWVDKHSAEDHNLSLNVGSTVYLHIDSNGAPLTQGTGLFVGTTLVNGNYFYAITSILNGIEKKTISAGNNSLSQPISEYVATPLPVFQEQHLVGTQSVYVYTTFFSSKRAIGQPLECPAAFIPLDFAVNRNYTGSGQHPMEVLLHGGGDDFLWNMELDQTDEIKLGLEERLPSGESNGWIGSNENYDIFKDNQTNTIPTSGINYNYEQEVISQTIDWAIKHLPVDSNRIYLNGTSLGAGGAFMYAITYPEKIAAVKVVVPWFNLAFENDYNPLCFINTGNKTRHECDVEFGTVSTNLMCKLGIHFYDAVNGGWMIHTYREKDYPVFFAMNGKHDVHVGWTEKPIFYDSVKANHIGGYYFWDERDHSGTNATWNDISFDLFRYASNKSFPAFANCSNDEDYGIGNDITGEEYGTVNGSLDWNDNTIVDIVDKWKMVLFVRDLKKANGENVTYPDSCIVDVTPRRLQQFQIPNGLKLKWTVTHENNIIQSGSQLYTGGVIVIPGVKIFKDSSVLELSYSADLTYFFRDADGDGYGNPETFIQAQVPPPGYVTDSTDCNDLNAAISPAASDICNGIDDNCSGQTDENAITATVVPSGNISVCEDVPIILTANGGDGISYQWYKNSEVINRATNQTYTPSKTASFSVTESNAFNCTSGSAPVSVTILDLPVATITPLGSLDICTTGLVNLQANSGTGLTYQWKKGSQDIAGATNKIYSATSKGTYKVTVTAANGCSKTSKGVQVIKSCKESFAGGNLFTELNCYPNPSTGQFTVDLKMDDRQSCSVIVEIINAFNQKVYAEIMPITNGELNQVIEATNLLVPGIYIIRIITGNHVFSNSLILQQ